VKERGTLGDLGANGIILKWILKIQDGKAWTGFIWLRIGRSRGVVLCAVMNLRVP
jgi:hypothetical protein